MKQIYDFEQHKPPILNENMILNETEKRRVRKQTALLAVAGILLQIVMVLLGFIAMAAYPWITLICAVYVLVSTTGGSILTIVFSKKGGDSIWPV